MKKTVMVRVYPKDKLKLDKLVAKSRAKGEIVSYSDVISSLLK